MEAQQGEQADGRHVVLVNAANSSSRTATLLFEDFADALLAYARVASSCEPQLQRVVINDTEDGLDRTLPLDGFSPDAPTCLVVAIPLCTEVSARTMQDCLSHTLNALGCSDTCTNRSDTPTRKPLVYVIAYADSRATTEAPQKLNALEAICHKQGCSWCGGILLGEASLYPKLFCSPRLGAYRRPLSQAIDRLVAAVRMGASMEETARVTGRSTCENIVVANPGLAPLARLLFSNRSR